MGVGGGSGDVARPVAAMVLVQVIFAGVNIFYKLAVCDGMDMRVLVAYRYLFASAFLAPLAYFIERRNRTKLTWRVVVLSFICGLTGGSLAQNLYISGMKLTSATFASATTNLIPAATFVLALIFRYERLAIRTFSGQAKLAGTLLGVGGAMLLTFYKGADVTPWHSSVNLVAHQHRQQLEVVAEATNRVMGSLLCISSCFFYAIWLILQAKLSKEYPFHYSSTALMCAMSTLQSVAFALCYDRDPGQWRLGFDVRLLSVVYSGVLASGVMLVVLSCSLLLGEKLHLGSALGAVLIVMGLYAVLWGKGRETELAAKVAELPTDDDDVDDRRRIDVVVQLPTAMSCLPPHTIHSSDHQANTDSHSQPEEDQLQRSTTR
ncbi:hypothetical protein SETIT_3G005500v2 [Setaria italica]|uniref:WAT1-related protein n=2 Tax=Setaria TaxID=4554 RepID=A0A368QA15_SETIT|nr:WAT1-related protein At1g25270 isoform X2 [Setaria italica]RCV14779.1 hypothetical protein SETIT_3G005500v2 [Setaria italica]